jgi:hypothetical protein
MEVKPIIILSEGITTRRKTTATSAEATTFGVHAILT